MLGSDLMAESSGSRIEVNGADDTSLRFLHWLGYFPDRIDGPRQSMYKQTAPGGVFRAPAAEEARYLAAMRAGLRITCAS